MISDNNSINCKVTYHVWSYNFSLDHFNILGHLKILNI